MAVTYGISLTLNLQYFITRGVVYIHHAVVVLVGKGKAYVANVM